MTVTPAAEKFMRRMVRFSATPAGGFRLTVAPGGCSGYSSEFSVEAAPHSGDSELALQLVEKLPLNSAWFDASSLAFFRGRPLKVRGNRQGGTFVARTFWPQDFRLPDTPAHLPLAADPAAVRAWVRAQPQGGAQGPFAVESLWRRPGSSGPRSGKPLLGLMLNGAQGDDDEAHAGHFALMTGRVGVQGGIDDWLVNNFYTLDAESEKGIIAAPVPLDNYLGDLNSGQAWYRPSYLLVATLKDARSAARLQSALGRVYNQFYRHQFAYQHARANCAGISLDTLRALDVRRLKAGSVLCVGAGGLGSPAAMYLAAAGVGRIGIVDFDVVDFSNLQRQIIHGTSCCAASAR